MKTYAKWIVIVALICLVAGGAGLYNVFNASNGFASETARVDENKSFPGSGVDSVTVSSGIFDIVALPASGDEIRVQWKGQLTAEEKKKFRMETNLRSGSLQVRIEPVDKFSFGLDLGMLLNLMFGNRERPVLEIALPANSYKNLDFKSDTGDMKLDSLSVDVLQAASDTGDISVHDTKGQRVQVKTDTGDIELVQADGELKLTSDTGDISAEIDALSHNVTAQTDTGDIRLNAKSAPALNVNLSTDTGDVAANVPALQNSLKGKHGVQGQKGTGGPSVNLRSDTGDLEVSVKE